MIEPRQEQTEVVETVWNGFKRGDDDQLIVLPTASGKTIIFTLLLEKCLKETKKAGRDFNAMVLVNKVKLVTQTREKLQYAIDEESIGLYCGTLGKYDEGSDVTVASIDTVKKTSPFIKLLIIDEAHNAHNVKRYDDFLADLREVNPNLKVVRFTATPFTAGDGYIYGPGLANRFITYRKTMLEMIELGRILDPKFTGSKDASFDTSSLRQRRGEFIQKELEKLTKDEKKTEQQVADALSRLSGRKKVVWACTCIEHAELVQSEINKYEPATTIHSKLKKSEQMLNMDDFENGGVRHITSVTMVSEGYDFPGIDAVVCLRPTRSPVLYVQLVGRALRLFPGKTDALFLDYGEVVENLGHPNDPVVKDKKKKKAEKKAIICPGCEHFIFLPASECKNCGYELYKEEQQERDKTKNLTAVASGIQFNNKAVREQTVKVLGMSIDEDYTSRAGNKCVMVTYSTMMNTYHEYLKIGTYYHKEWEKERAARPGQTPVKIYVVKEKGYWRVKRRYY